ncbi:methyltransferase-like protein 22 [Microcaecilia unicolor]|uniref:Methyltransferase-like protein 22 n=1 Tax=Microcaecilia unicolor TaxID=1415580 RepID=A0A6P7YZ18_9AMPH|nr:methyltransferase-like protein 22 [Microcaecilia unicolor]XP_030068716.1 methyltransferase-like protein 22 [Microcaecilia unicolor]XP_030068717.1 methyltransferase-like protein 22 [Microcaecilia unicolor]XP_030068718.1 methyltransferase-like protein 22 [Microcaecilia unicolor]XP_030068719.1 methyltransferase-like protein 22 [Microcaecilia unicolor]
MDDISFRSDTVLSDIHLHMPNKSHLMVRLNAVGQPVFVSHFQILWDEDLRDDKHSKNGSEREAAKERDKYCGNWRQEEGGNSSSEVGIHSYTFRGLEALLDDDGDLEVIRKPLQENEEHSRETIHPIILTKAMEDPTEELERHSQDIIKIEHTMATPLEDVGKQIWRGAFLLADYLLWKRDLFRSCTALELGAGTGLTSIIMATVAKTIYCTDVGEDLLDMCERNITLNKHLRNLSGAEVKVKELDWLKNEFCTDPGIPFSWSEEDIADFYDSTSVILAADVFYDDDLTDAVFRTFYRIVHNLKNPCTVYLTIERRLNFTLRHMDISCDAYNHFRKCLHDLENTSDGKMKFTAEPIKPAFPQFFVYERVEQLELWKITTKPLS